MKLPRCAAAFLLASAATLLIGYALSEHRISAHRMEAWREQQADARLRDELEKLVEFQGGKLKLAEFAALVSQVSGWPVKLDEQSIALGTNVQHPATMVVRVPRGTFPLRSALWIALEPMGLAADLRSGTLHLTTIDESIDRQRQVTVVYSLPQPDPAGMDENDWCWAVISHACSKGGHVEPVPGALVVLATADGHRRIRATVAAISRFDDAPREPTPFPPLGPGNVQQRICAALLQPADFDFDGVPLCDVVAMLSDHYRIPMLLDGRRLADAGIPLTAPVLKLVSDISLSSALRLLLKDFDLTFVVREGVLLITTPDEAESQLEDLAYPVGDLVETLDGPQHAALCRIITSTIAPASWEDVGGPGSICLAGGGWMLISQTKEMHEQIRQLLGDLRQALASEASLVPSWPKPTAAEAKIQSALARRVPLDFAETPLKDAVWSLGRSLGIPIVLNAKTLSDAGVDLATPITCRLPPGPFALQLQMLLEPLDLTYVIRDEVIQISTPDDAESQLVTRIFNVRSLLATRVSPESLIVLLMRLVAPQSWDVVGGPGSVQHFRGLLLVSQTGDVQQEIQQLLRALGEHCGPARRNIPLSAKPIQLKNSLDRKRLEELLDEPRPIEIPGLPLLQALRKLSDEHGLPMVPDTKALGDAGLLEVDSKLPPAEAATRRQALNQLLAPPNLGWMIREHVISATTPDRIESLHEMRLYWVGDLAGRSLPARALRLALWQTTLDDWLVADVEALDPDWLVIRASQLAHQKIEDWLDEQRKIAGIFRETDP